MTAAFASAGAETASALKGRRVQVKVPATSANLGPGFDTLGLALARYDELDVEATDAPAHVIEVHGVGAGEVPAGSTVVLTVTGHGLKDPQWALRNAEGGEIAPTIVPVDVSEVASVLGLVKGTA